MFRLSHVRPRVLCTRTRVVASTRLASPSLGRSFCRSPTVALQDGQPRPSSQDTKRHTEMTSFHRAHAQPYPARTHHCGELSAKNAGSRVVLAGWLLPGRKAGKSIYFFPLKDAYGTVQLVASDGVSDETLTLMRDTPGESTVLVEGVVIERPPNQKRPQPGGDIEVSVTSFTLLNPALRDLPFAPSDTRNLPNEEYRLRYRYLDLRRPYLSANLHKRSEVAHIIRTTLHEKGFVEVETPILLKSTPEGAREFLVPTRLSSASTATPATDEQQPAAPAPAQPLFYALPQSPQQPKQLLIASGAVDRYYQIAKCFRDEDGRKDRQPEFTQVDLEMAWVSWGAYQASDQPAPTQEQQQHTANSWRIGGTEVRDVVQTIIRNIWAKAEGVELPESFKVMTYNDAMGRFGSDKPDTRFGLELRDVSAHLPVPFRDTLSQQGEIVEALVVSACDETFRRAAAELAPQESGITRIDALESGSSVSGHDHDDGQLGAPEIADALKNALGLQRGDTVWLARRTRLPEGGSTILGRLRLALASLAQTSGDLDLDAAGPHFLWVTEFPLFTHADSDKEFQAHGRWSSSHHPFTAPMWEDVEKMYSGRVAEVRGQHYDLVLNGTEIGGGSVRVHDPAMQNHIFSQILQLDEAEKASFGHLLHALECGAPPHGGIALGFDRLMAILCKADSIRDVIAFPKTGAGTDLLFKSPAPAREEALREYGIRAR